MYFKIHNFFASANFLKKKKAFDPIILSTTTILNKSVSITGNEKNEITLELHIII